MSAVATVGIKYEDNKELELDQNYGTCLSSGGQCMFGGLNFKFWFCQNGTGLPGNFLTWCRF